MLDIDDKLLMDLEKESTGKYIHDTSAWCASYKYYCQHDEVIHAVNMETRLRARLAQIRLEKVKGGY